MAERINGVIKNNYLKFICIDSLAQLMTEVDRIVKLYNEERPHKTLKYKTPKQFENELLSL
jgi:putative transposase